MNETMSYPATRSSALRRLGIAVAAAFICIGSAARASDMSVRVYNRSDDDVISIYIAPTYERGYGDDDVLGNATIPAGHTRLVDFDIRDAEGECVLDVKAVGTHSNWTKRVNVCSATTWTLYD